MRTYGQFCPISKAAEVFCERWTPLILRDLGKGVSRFSELQRGVARASPTMLSRRLKELEVEGLVERRRSKSGRGWTYSALQVGHPEHLGASSEARNFECSFLARPGTPNVAFWPLADMVGCTAEVSTFGGIEDQGQMWPQCRLLTQAVLRHALGQRGSHQRAAVAWVCFQQLALGCRQP